MLAADYLLPAQCKRLWAAGQWARSTVGLPKATHGQNTRAREVRYTAGILVA